MWMSFKTRCCLKRSPAVLPLRAAPCGHRSSTIVVVEVTVVRLLLLSFNPILHAYVRLSFFVIFRKIRRCPIFCHSLAANMSAFLFKHPGGATSIRHALRLRPAEARRSGGEWKQHVAAAAALLSHEESYMITSLNAIDDNIF